MKEINSQIDQGLTFSAARLSVAEYLSEWTKNIELTLRPKTWIQYKQVVRDHLLPYLGKIKLKDLRPDQVQSLYSRKLEEGKSIRTVRLTHAVLRRAMNQAVMWGLIGRNPVLAVKPPKQQKKEMKYLTEAQVKVLLGAVDETRYSALYYLAVTTGLRQGELLGLKWSDFDWGNKRFQVQRQLQRITGKGLVFSEPKTKAGKRSIAIGKIAIKKLRRHQEILCFQREISGDRWQENDLVFPSTIGTPLGPRNLSTHFYNLLIEIDLPKIRFHDLRHTAATLMFKQGVHPKVVQERLGHSSIVLTMDTYSHVIPSMQEDVADILDKALVSELQ
ncbi:MAG: site-specific integrase [Anaerolineae bacterium]|nr:site-specific integrase [Anaerolineae bacterium]MBT7073836.1 site-specific integrase [Anaerolineae bacterium]